MDSSSIIPGIISLFVLIAFNAFFVTAEYSLAVSRRTRITELAAQGNSAAKVVQRLMDEPDHFFAATQIGVTFMSIAIGIFSEPAFTALFRAVFMAGDALAPWWQNVTTALSAIIGLLVASYFQIVLAELVPRSLAQHSPEPIALAVVPPMNALARLFTPFIWLLKMSSRFVVGVLGVRGSIEERPHSIAELQMLVAASERGGLIESDQREMLNAIFTFGDTTVREVMTPRTEVICVDVETTLTEVVHLLSVRPISRLPVYEGSLDHIVGILHSKDMIRAIAPAMRGLTVRQLMREAFFVPDSQRADELLQQFRARHEHMAIVLDEYGGTSGLVTLDDLLAEIVGEVGDVTTDTPPDILHSTDGTAVINGLTSIGDVNEAFSLDLVDPNYDTIGGYIMGQLGRIPKVGDEVELKTFGVRIRVEEMDKLRVAKVKLARIANPAGSALPDAPYTEHMAD
ncbi:MAG: hemolysin family protein [Chloroflexi bacterium]|nr:hemolysin family protein [Chloroflexota bacterium]MCL5275838.1 hemolysin family protein [Chloroflexota bacterium]